VAREAVQGPDYKTNLRNNPKFSISFYSVYIKVYPNLQSEDFCRFIHVIYYSSS